MALTEGTLEEGKEFEEFDVSLSQRYQENPSGG
jgi:hypothetical protein